MKIWKIVSGALSIAISLFVVFQSFFAGLLNIITSNGQSSGTAGIVVAIVLFTGGIVAIATHNGSRGGDIAMAVLYGLGAIVGFVGAGNYTDLYIWSLWCLLCAAVAMVDFAIISQYQYEDDDEEEEIPEPAPMPKGKRTPLPFQAVILEKDPKKRDAVIDALPERQAKSYLKQAMNVLVPRQAAASQKSDDDGFTKIIIAVVAAFGVFVVGIIVVFGITSTSGGNQAAASNPPAPSVNVQESDPPSAAPTEEASDAPAIGQDIASGTLGSYYVEIKSAFITTDYDGDWAIAVTYSWTNNSENTTNASVALARRAFQNGVQLDGATMSSRNPNYDSEAAWRDIRPGTTLEVQCAFKLQDTTSPVEVEIYESFSFSDDVVLIAFDPSALPTVE